MQAQEPGPGQRRFGCGCTKVRQGRGWDTCSKAALPSGSALGGGAGSRARPSLCRVLAVPVGPLRPCPACATYLGKVRLRSSLMKTWLPFCTGLTSVLCPVSCLCQFRFFFTARERRDSAAVKTGEDRCNAWGKDKPSPGL